MSQKHILPVSDDEVTAAKRTEVKFVGKAAGIWDGRLRLIFHLGSLKTHDHEYTTTSYYELIDTRSGKPLVRVESRLSTQWNDQERGQKAWFSPDGHIGLICEDLSDGDEVQVVSALLVYDPEDSSWTVRYLWLPKFEGLPYREDGPVPAGLLGDMIVFDPLAPGSYHKMKLSEVPVGTKPLPFTTG